MQKNRQILGFIIGLMLIPNMSHATEKYCAFFEGSTVFDVHLFPGSYSDGEQYRFLSGLDGLTSDLTPGDKLRLIEYSEGKGRVKFQECLPGCPTTSFLEGLMKSECLTQVAKKDLSIFKSKYARAVRESMQARPAERDLMIELEEVEAFYRGSSFLGSKFLLHSLDPQLIDGKPDYDAAFVKAIQSGVLSKLKLEQVTVVNRNSSRENDSFWQDLRLEGNDQGLSIELNQRKFD